MKSALLVLLLAAPARANCPEGHPYECRSSADMCVRDTYSGCNPANFQGPCCDKNPDCTCDMYCGEGCNDGALRPIPSSTLTCPASNPHMCASAADMCVHESYSGCNRANFQGPCCDRNADCTCDDYCGEGCSGGAVPIPQSPSAVSRPDHIYRDDGYQRRHPGLGAGGIAGITVGAILGVVALGALGYVLYQKQNQSNGNFRNQVEITPTQWTQSSQPGTQMYESPLGSPVAGTQVYGNPIMSSTSETPVVHSTEGAKFDPHTGQPIPKFDPMTGKQNWV